MSDMITPEKRSWNMSRIRGKDTAIEVKVRKRLFSLGYRYRKNDSRLPGKPDIVLPKYKTVIFVNGCFWHGHEGCRYFVMPKSNGDFWANKIKGNIERDKRIESDLKKLGYNVITVWECQLKRDIFQETMEGIINHINNRE